MFKTVCLFIGLVACACASALAKDLYVSPKGNDHNKGTLQQPFATLQKAQEAARMYQHQATTIWVRQGVYYFNQPIIFTAADARTADAPLSIRAYQQEQPVISGSSLLKLQWQPYKNGLMQARVTGDFIFDELFVNGRLQRMARYPNYDAEAKHYHGPNAAFCMAASNPTM